jgi:hypothetical protein
MHARTHRCSLERLSAVERSSCLRIMAPMRRRRRPSCVRGPARRRRTARPASSAAYDPIDNVLLAPPHQVSRVDENGTLWRR